jgi:hypothetical protein
LTQNKLKMCSICSDIAECGATSALGRCAAPAAKCRLRGEDDRNRTPAAAAAAAAGYPHRSKAPYFSDGRISPLSRSQFSGESLCDLAASVFFLFVLRFTSAVE